MFAPRSAWLCRVISLFLFACVPVFSQSSQSVSGCVQDPSHAAIRTASVTLTSSDTFTRFQRHTDEKGCFTFDDVHPGKYQLRVLAESFSPYEKDITAENAIEPENIVLEIRPVQATAVVTATRSLASTSDVAASVDVIDRLQIEASHIEAASDLLRHVGGIQVVRTGNPGGITSLFTRGGASTYTKILLDGIPLNQPGGAYDFAHIPTDNIGRVEVVRGPQSALFGSDAITGVVQVVTRPGSGSPEGDYSIEAGNYATLKQSAGLRGSWKKFDWSNTFSRLDTDNIRPNNDYRNASYFGNFGFAPDSWQTLRGTLFHISSRAGTPGADAPGFISFGPDNHSEDLEKAAGLTYQALVGTRLTQHLAYSVYNHDYRSFSAFGVSPLAHTRYRAEYHGDVSVPVAGAFSYGVDFDREDGKVSGVSHVRNNTGYYVQQQFQAWNRLNVTAGVRIEDNATFGTSTNPKLGVSVRVWPGARLRFSVGTGIREPSFTENFSPNRFFLGNANLLPEHSRSWEAGIEQSFAGKITGDLTVFDNRFRNVIELVSRPDFSGQYQNIGRSLARGAEWRMKMRVRQLLIQTNYTYLDGHIVQSSQASFPFRTSDPLLRRAKHSGDVSLTWTDRKWRARWSTRAVGRRADSDFFTYITPLTSNPGYSVSDAAFTYEFARPVSAFMLLDNIFNKQYQEVLGYRALGHSFVVGTRIRVGRDK